MAVPKTGSISAFDLKRGDVVKVSQYPGYVVLLEDPHVEEDDPEEPKYLEAQTRNVSKNGRLCAGSGTTIWNLKQRVRICGWNFAEQVERRLKAEDQSREKAEVA